jgi:two-component system, LuxR family, sensor histidine kinase DctS
MSTSPAFEPAARQRAPRPRLRRALLWGALVALLLVAQSLLVALTLAYEATRAQAAVETVASEAVAEVKRNMGLHLQNLQALGWNGPPLPHWRTNASALLHARREVLRIERRDEQMAITDAVDSPFTAPVFVKLPREQLSVDAEVACSAVMRIGTPAFSRSYFVPLPGGLGLEVIDVCVPVPTAGPVLGFMVATFGLTALLDESVSDARARRHELSFTEADGTRLARAGTSRGAGVYHAQQLVDLPGTTLQLRVDSAEGRPDLIPNLATALVLGLSIALFGLVLLLARDVRKRALAEGALAEALAFRKAMEDSLSTGLRARDLQGRITYVNPAFCAMVGFASDELVRAETPPETPPEVPPYWPPERSDEYSRRQASRLQDGREDTASVPGAAFDPRQGFETVFMRKDGARFPVMIYEAPLVDGNGTHSGWMSSVLDMSAQRKVEEFSRQQQERLQATARLATVGEMASLLSHELNQPLAAIASYATGSLNLLEAPDAQTPSMLQHAMTRIAEQAERAGRVIKSVHAFVRRREHARETVRADELFDAVMPLVRLQTRKSGARVELDLQQPPPHVQCDRTMVEQVLLNLTRNGIQAMEEHTPLAERVLSLGACRHGERWVMFSVIDRGSGVPPEVAQRLFTPFFTTRSEGMGLGLSLCRTVIEQHGGALDFETLPERDGQPGGTRFRFTLPAGRLASRGPAQDDADGGSTSA